MGEISRGSGGCSGSGEAVATGERCRISRVRKATPIPSTDAPKITVSSVRSGEGRPENGASMVSTPSRIRTLERDMQ